MQVELEFEIGEPDNERLYSRTVEVPFTPFLGLGIFIGDIEAKVVEVDYDTDQKKLYARLTPVIPRAEEPDFIERIQKAGFTTAHS